MATRVSIDKSLVVRHGRATYQFNRLFDDRRQIQFENQLTGEYRAYALTRFFAMLQSGDMAIVQGEQVINDFPGVDKKRQILDISALPEKEQEQLGFRIRVVRFLQKKGLSRGQRTEVSQAIKRLFEAGEWQQVWHKKTPPSTSAVLNWMRDYEISGRNPASLISGNLNRKRMRTVSVVVEEAMAWALKTYYLKKTRLSLTYAFERLGEKLKGMVARGELSRNEATVSMATFQRRKDELDPFAVTAARHSQDYANKQFRYTLNGTNVPRAMARLKVDHTLLNWVVVCDRTGLPLGRPTLTIIVDSYSGYIVGLYVSFNGPGLTTVINVLKNSIRPKHDIASAAETSKPWIAWGIGDCYLLDNGMEFHAYVFRRVAWELACDLEYCRVRFPWLKPHVERVFAELDYLTLVQGRVRKPDPNILAIDPKRDAIITLSQLCTGLVKFAVDHHASQVNRRTLEIPFERFAESMVRNPPPEIPDTMQGLDLIAAMSKTSTVSSGGVEFYGLSFAGLELRDLLRSAGGKFKTLVKWNPDDLGYMYVQDSRSKEWLTLTCTRSDYAQGLSWNQHRLIRDFTRNRLRLSGAVDNLLIAKQDLHELWMNPLARKNRDLNFDRARRLNQLCTTASTFQDHAAAGPLPPKATLAAEELTRETTLPPDFETVVF